MELNAIALAARLTARLVVLLLLAVGLRVNQAPATIDEPTVPVPVMAIDETVTLAD